jgi:hypothetical protein
LPWTTTLLEMRFHADCHLPLQIAATLPALLAIMGPASYSLAAEQGCSPDRHIHLAGP